jgi:hypothetical protein
MLVPEVSQALGSAEDAIDTIQLTARRRGAQVRGEALSAIATASASIEGSEPAIVASLLMELDQLALRTSFLQALARMHALVGVDEPVEARGRPRPDFDQSARLRGLADLIATSQSPALLVATVAHGELLALQPFASANGILARAVWRGIIVESGLDPTGLVMSEVGVRDLGVPAYRAALDAYQRGTSEGVASWIRHCCRAVELGVDALAQLLSQKR